MFLSTIIHSKMRFSPQQLYRVANAREDAPRITQQMSRPSQNVNEKKVQYRMQAPMKQKDASNCTQECELRQCPRPLHTKKRHIERLKQPQKQQYRCTPFSTT